MHYKEIYDNFLLEPLVTEFEGVIYVEEWKPIKGLEAKYAISSFGRIKRLKRYISNRKEWQDERIRKIWLRGKYLKVTLGNKHYYIHRLVCSAFHANPFKKPQVNHKDAVKYNNFFMNVEWSTQSENNRHAVQRNLCYQQSTKHVSWEDRQYIRNNFFKESREELAKKFNINEEQVYTIGTNKRYINRLLSEERKPNTTQYRYA